MTVRYGNGTVGVSDIDFCVDSGEMVVLVGPSGAGKSTCLAVMSARAEATSGSVFIGGVDVNDLGRAGLARWRRATGFVIQDGRLLERRTVRENIAYGAEIAQPDVCSVDIDRRVTDMLARLGISEIANRLPSEVSGGERHRTALAQALIKQPRILFADEPTANVDPATASMLAAVLDEYRHGGMACVMASHNETAFTGLITRQVRLHAGKIRKSTTGSNPWEP